MRVGFIGLGNIGRPMAERLVLGGFETLVYDVREEARQALAARGARPVASCAEMAAAADFIAVCVRDDRDVREVMLGSCGVLGAGRAGQLVALHSTILPSTVREVARAAEEHGVAVIDAPVTGGAAGAQSGQLTYMVGGEAGLVERARPVFATSAARIVHTGGLGSGAATKLCNNLMTYASFLAAFEASLLAGAAGLSFEALEEVGRSNGNLNDQNLAFLRLRRMIEEQPENDSLQAMARSFSDLADKDLAVTLAFAGEIGVTLSGVALCRQLMARVYGVRDERR